MTASPRLRRLAVGGAVATCALMLVIVAADAQGRNPFGVGAPAPGVPANGLVAWMLIQQAELHRGLVAATRAVREGGGAGWLMISAFLYGAFHAAGPGHGKAIVSSYVFANEKTLRRGVVISFAAAFIQAAIAIAIVWAVLEIFAGTARTIDATVRWVEIGSFAMIAGFGALLAIRKARALWALKSAAAADCAECGRFQLRYKPSSVGAAAAPIAPACGHVVIPNAATLATDKGWRELVSIAFAAGSRPCTGAILILALARAGGIFPAGMLAVLAMALGTAITTSAFAIAASGIKSFASRTADRIERLKPLVLIAELAAALAVTALGLLLLVGYLSGD